MWCVTVQAIYQRPRIDMCCLYQIERIFYILCVKLSCGTKILRELNFAERRFFCLLRELMFATGKDKFFLLEINFCDFLEVAFKWN